MRDRPHPAPWRPAQTTLPFVATPNPSLIGFPRALDSQLLRSASKCLPPVRIYRRYRCRRPDQYRATVLRRLWYPRSVQRKWPNRSLLCRIGSREFSLLHPPSLPDARTRRRPPANLMPLCVCPGAPTTMVSLRTKTTYPNASESTEIFGNEFLLVVSKSRPARTHRLRQRCY